ncbi:MAG: hypothetical protein N2578_02395 [Bdellovibrionaceae bacterium]|nr:hypothetical protein [Pseudobdellovibrionaceae bacterium]
MMNLISHSSALNPGSDLWIMADSSSSRWPARIDWYLNFQIYRHSRRVQAAMPDKIQEILTLTALPSPSVPDVRHRPLMIPSLHRIPTRWIVLVPWNSSLPDWISATQKVWVGLQRPTLRIFLPTEVQQSDFTRAWPEPSNLISVVLD